MNIFLKMISLMAVVSIGAWTQQVAPADFVNTFIGTGGHGHTFPGATRPFGMVQLSPDTRVVGWDACAGYHYSDSSILGFSHTHLSGTGVGDYGDILFSPMTGTVRTDSGSVDDPGYRSAFTHADEYARPGYYRVALRTKRILAEMTTTRRTGVHRYTFPKTDSAWIVIDLVHGIGPDVVLDASLEITGKNEITGYRRSRGWAKDQYVYFVAQFSKPFRSFGVSNNGEFTPNEPKTNGKAVKGAVRFSIGEDDPLVVRVGVSATDPEGARLNLAKEMNHWDFDAVRQAAYDEWNTSLSRIQVEGGTHEQLRTFYTALYHAFVAPNVFSDVDGRYRTMTGTIDTADGYDRYTVFSLWDTFRAAHPLFTILEPERTADFIRSFIAIHEESSHLPVWELAANETWTMIGNHAVPPIVDAYKKGIRGYDPEKAFRAMRESGMQDGRGMASYRTRGFVPSEEESESASKTLEYAYDDWCVSEMARLLGKENDERTFSVRAASYRNLFDERTGFFRARERGAWKEPFSPRAVTIDYTEANAWQYAFFVPHDVAGMISLFGGREAFSLKLDEMFRTGSELEGRDQADITGLIGQYAHGNEPSHHIAYLFAYAGQPWKTQELVRRIMGEFYADRPDGLIGNEDCGQMSAWYVFSALGFYPVNPAQPLYTLGIPLFPGMQVDLPNGKTFTIRTEGASAGAYVHGVSLNGEFRSGCWISHEELLRGGELTFTLSNEPDTTWAVEPGEAPPSPPGERVVQTPVSSAPSPSFQDSIWIRLSTSTPGAEIQYTLDGSDPDISSQLYASPIVVTSTTTLRAKAFRPGWHPSGTMEATYSRFRRIGTVVSIAPYSPQYSAGGDQAIVDGIRGTADFRVGGWQGFEGIDAEAVVDLGEEKTVRHISASFLHDNDSWIFFPAVVTFGISDDGISFENIASVHDVVPPDEPEALVKSVSYEGRSRHARFVRIIARNIGVCPPWHRGSGGKAWVFIDEVDVR